MDGRLMTPHIACDMECKILYISDCTISAWGMYACVAVNS